MYDYDAETSFNTYLNDVILPQLPAGTHLYFIDELFSYPAVFVHYPYVDNSVVEGMGAVIAQVETLNNNYDERTCKRLRDQLRDLLKVSDKKEHNGSTATAYTFNDPENPVEAGHIKWKSNSQPVTIKDKDHPEIVRFVFEIKVEFVP
jgi:hypothetical protein